MQPKILEDKTIVAMRGRNPDNPSDRTVGSPTEQRLEPNSQGLCNTLTSVQKDNLVMEKMCISTKGKENEVASTILAGYERTNMTGFNADNAVCENVYDFYNNNLKSDGVCGTLTSGCSRNGSGTFGVIEESILQMPRGYNKGGKHSICPPITSNSFQENNLLNQQYRIRKLTPRECWRLMDFADEDFEKAAQVNSNTQLYKQAGNSIPKNLLVAIFGQMILGKENIYKEN